MGQHLSLGLPAPRPECISSVLEVSVSVVLGQAKTE